jgi:uncharacterized SAM-binding protein YcdF (DUF218 family)
MLWVYFPLLVLVAAFLILLWKSGHALVAGEPLERASWAFVLPGETLDCEATDAAATWVNEGRIDTLVVMGGRTYKTRFTTEWARDYLETKGMPAERLFEMRLDAQSTLDAARQVMRLARLQGLDTLHLIVSNFQSRRMARLYSQLAGGMPIVKVHPVATPTMRPNAWWATPQSQALWIFGWMGYAHTWWETLSLQPDRVEAEVRNLTPDIWSAQGLVTPEPEVEESVVDSMALQAALDSAKAAELADSASQVLDSLKSLSAPEAKAEEKDSSKAEATPKAEAKTETKKKEPKKAVKSEPVKSEKSTKKETKKEASKKDAKKEAKK